jgi:hypothetical protein
MLKYIGREVFMMNLCEDTMSIDSKGLIFAEDDLIKHFLELFSRYKFEDSLLIKSKDIGYTEKLKGFHILLTL